MKYLVLSIITILSVTISSAQKTDEQIIADSSFGWMKIYHYKGIKTPRTINGRTFSATQLSLVDTFCNWIQASYTPKGTIGDVRKGVLAYKDQPYRPQGVSATSYTWTLYMNNGKPTPIQETEIPWSISTNEVPGVILTNISSNADCYFMMEEKSPFFSGTPQSVIDKYNIKTLPQFAKFHTTHSTASHFDRNASIVESVVLCKDNKLPFIRVTVGELLEQAEKLINRSHEEELASIREKNKNDQKGIDYFSRNENDNYERALTTIAKHKERYKNKWNEPASLPRTFAYIDFVNRQDIFTRIMLDEISTLAPNELFPVYKLAPGTIEQAKQDKPLWIRVTWSWQQEDQRQLHMHQSIINNFNFQYLFDFFFDPLKVKGVPYQPLRSPDEKEAVVVTELSNSAKKANADKSVFFFEDFSGNAEGQSPAGWYSPINLNSSKATVVTLQGLKGKWVEIKGNLLIPNNLKKPLPADFELSFDAVVPRDIPWGTKALEVYLGTNNKKATNDSYVKARIRAGFSGRAGELYLEQGFNGPYFSEMKSYYEMPGFSNDKELNKASFAFIKKGNTFEMKMNGSSLAYFKDAFPNNTLFNWLEVNHMRSDGDNQKYYISNIKITKL